jgi:aspartate aminotransferase
LHYLLPINDEILIYLNFTILPQGDNMSLSQRVQNIKPSPTLAVSAKAAELKAAGKDIIGLGVGEPDFDTPEHIKDAAIKAIRDGDTKYTAVDGTVQLKSAIVDKFQEENQLSYQPNQILVSCGAKQSLYNLVQATINAGDEVIIPAPYWVSYPDIVILGEGVPVIIQASQQQNFKILPEQLEQAITNRTKLLILNSPSNPTGCAYTQMELKALAQVLLKHPQVLVVSDDIYEHILWDKDKPFCNIVQACPELYERCIVINGVSKAYAMTGWRIGYAAGDATIIKAMKKIQSQSTSNPASVSQAAACAALDQNNPLNKKCIDTMLTAFQKRHDFVVETLNDISGIECIASQGTFYSFPSVTGLMSQLDVNSDVELCAILLEKAGVALVPGSAFGTAGHLRLSYATSQEVLTDALNRIKSLTQA